MTTVDPDFLLNFLNTYPLPSDPKFHEKLFLKKELYDQKLSPIENDPTKPGELYQYQKIQRMLFSPNTPYNKAIINAAPGVGKTCIISSIVENFKDIIINGVKRRPALVVVPNSDLAITMMKEISDKCTVDLYKAVLTTKHIRKGIVELTEKMAFRSFKKAFSMTYKVVTMEKFFLGKEHKLVDFYSNRIICIDEAHSIREYTKSKNDESLYSNVHKFLHRIRDCRILLFTGTFIWDTEDEAVSTLNLLLEEKDQIPLKNFRTIFFDKKKKLTENAKNILKKSMFISVLRGMEGAPKKEIGFDGSKEVGFIEKFRVHPDVFSDFQSRAVLEQLKKYEKEKDEDPNKNYKLAYLNTFVYPKFSDGKIIGYYPDSIDGYNSDINNKTYSITNRNLEKIVEGQDLRIVSSKYASTIDAIEKNPEEKAIIYEEFIKGSGTTLLAAIFRSRGYEIISTDSAVETMLKSKRKRVMLITGSNEYKYKNKIIKGGPIINSVTKAAEAYSHPNNAKGEYCQVVIGSKKIILGYSFKETRQFHIIEPHWNDPLMEQALYRGYRAGSFLSLPEKERYYKIYRHFTVHPQSARGDKIFKPKITDVVFPPKTSFSNIKTRDWKIYDVVEEKSIYRSEIIRFAMENSYDCGLTYERNVLPSDEDYSKQCNYEKCNYECEGLSKFVNKDNKIWAYKAKKSAIDKTTYNAFHSHEESHILTTKIIDLLKNYISINVSNLQLYLNLENVDEYIISKSIDNLISSRTIIRDDLNRKYYVNHHRGILYLTELSGTSSSSDSYYVRSKTFSQKLDINEVINNVLVHNDLENTKNICKVVKSSSPLEKISYPSRVGLLEYSYINIDKKIKDWNPKSVLDNFSIYIHKLKDGTILHTMLSDEFQEGSYTVVQKIYKGDGKFRIYDSEKRDWKFLRNRLLEQKYEVELKEKERKKPEKVSTINGISGRLPADKKFRIISKYTPKGRWCNTIPIHTIVKIYIDLGCGGIDDVGKFINKNKKELLEFISLSLKNSEEKEVNIINKMIEKLEDKQLRNLAMFISMSGISSEMCPLLQKILDEGGAMRYE